MTVREKLAEAEHAFFGSATSENLLSPFEVVSAYCGEDGCVKVQEAREQGTPIDIAFVDMRMPPGWDGLETSEQLWSIMPNLEIVLCTAFSDYSWGEIHDRLPGADRLLILKKPFDVEEVRQIVANLSSKIRLAEREQDALHNLRELLDRATSELAARRDSASAHLNRSVRECDLKTANIVHEHRNLLQVILGYVDLAMTRAPDDSPIQEYLRQACEAAERASEVTRDYLGQVRAHSPVGQHATTFRLNDVVAKAAAQLRPLLHSDVALIEALDPDVPAVLGYPEELQQAILNLGINANDAMPEGGCLTIETRQFECQGKHPIHAPLPGRLPAGSYACLRVSDTGCGVSNHVLNQMFEPFFTTRGGEGGTGLGLPMVYRTVRQQGGTLEVESEPGSGTSFLMYFPAASPGTVSTPVQQSATG